MTRAPSSRDLDAEPDGATLAASSAAPLAAATVDGVRIVELRTGWVRVKQAHRALAGPEALRTLAIALDPRWTPWLPIRAWAVVHPEGPLVVDAGETPRVAEPGWFACDPGTRLFYEHCLRFQVPAGLASALRAADIAPADVRRVVLTHLHSDHAGGLGDLPHAAALVSPADWAGPRRGALPCRWPARFRPEAAELVPEPVGAFSHSCPLTRDGRVRLVPTPGHTRGHQSVLVLPADGSAAPAVLVAGDATFAERDVREGLVAGICEDPAAARRTIAVLREQAAAMPTVYLPSHDAEAGARLSGLTPMRPR